jgi:DNA-binding transcriptional LysR family regulator
MDFQRMRYFQSIARTGHLRKSAELLRISPPALSKAMKVLSEEVGFELFQTDGKRLLLTDAGKNFLSKAEIILEQVEALKDVNQGFVPDAKFRIATFEVFSTYFLSFIDKIGWGSKPLELQEGLPGEIENLVLRGHADVAISYMPIPHPDLDFMKITAIEMGVFTRQGSFPEMAQKDLPFVVPAQPIHEAPSRLRGLDGWPEDAYKRKTKYEVTLLESALELCRQGKAAGYFPKFIVEEHNRRVLPEFRLERRRSPYGGRVCTTDVYLVKRKVQKESQEIKQIAKAIRLVCW